ADKSVLPAQPCLAYPACLAYRPTASRCARTSGRPALTTLACASSTLYGARSSSTRRSVVSTIAYAARGSPSRGWPTEPGLIRYLQPSRSCTCISDADDEPMLSIVSLDSSKVTG